MHRARIVLSWGIRHREVREAVSKRIRARRRVRAVVALRGLRARANFWRSPHPGRAHPRRTAARAHALLCAFEAGQPRDLRGECELTVPEPSRHEAARLGGAKQMLDESGKGWGRKGRGPKLHLSQRGLHRVTGRRKPGVQLELRRGLVQQRPQPVHRRRSDAKRVLDQLRLMGVVHDIHDRHLRM
jgi:hypothetical protein